MDKIRQTGLFKIISLALILTFISLDISSAYPPEYNAGNSTLAVPSVFQQQAVNENMARFTQSVVSQSELFGSVCSVAKYLLEDNLPIKHLEQVISTELGHAVEGIDLSRITAKGGVVSIPCVIESKKRIVQIALKNSPAAENLTGEELFASDKYVIKVLLEDTSASGAKSFPAGEETARHDRGVILNNATSDVTFTKFGEQVTFPKDMLMRLKKMADLRRKMRIEPKAFCNVADGVVVSVDFQEDENKIAVLTSGLPRDIIMNETEYFSYPAVVLANLRNRFQDLDVSKEISRTDVKAISVSLEALLTVMIEYRTTIDIFMPDEGRRVSFSADTITELGLSELMTALRSVTHLGTEWITYKNLDDYRIAPGRIDEIESPYQTDPSKICIHAHPVDVASPPSAIMDQGRENGDIYMPGFFGGIKNGLILDTPDGEELFILYEKNNRNKDRYHAMFSKFWGAKQSIIADLREVSMQPDFSSPGISGIKSFPAEESGIGLQKGEVLRIADGVERVELSFNRNETDVRGEAFFIEPAKVEVEQVVDEDVRSRDIIARPMTDPSFPPSGKLIEEYVKEAADSGNIVLAFNGQQGDFWDPNSLVIKNGELIAKSSGAKGIFQQIYSTLSGTFWVLSFDKDNKSVHEIQLNEGRAIGTLPVTNGIVGQPLIVNGISMLDRIKFNVRPSINGDELNWPSPDTRMAMSAIGYSKDGKLVRVALSGDPDDKERREASLKDLIDVLHDLGVINAVLTGSSADVQSYYVLADEAKVKHVNRARARAQSATGKVFPNGRPLGTCILVRQSVSGAKSYPAGEEKETDGATQLFEIVESSLGNERAKFIESGNKLIDSLPVEPNPAAAAGIGVLDKSMPTAEIRERVEKAIEIASSFALKLKSSGRASEDRSSALRPPRNDDVVEFLESGMDQFEADGVAGSLIILARKAKKENQKLIIGLETDWIPGYNEKGNLQAQALNPVIREIESIPSMLRSMGLDNVVLIHAGSKELASSIMQEADNTHTKLSNVIILASKNTVDSDSFRSLRSSPGDEKAFIAGIDPAELEKFFRTNTEALKQLNIKILEMLSIVLDLAVGKDLPNIPMIVSYDKALRIVMLLPRAEPKDYEHLKRGYNAQKKALEAA